MGSNQKYDISKDELRKLYVEKEYSKRKLAEYYDCSEWVINNRLENFNIEQRSLKEQMNSNSDIDISKKKLHELYCEKEYSSFDIAEMIDCSAPTVRKKLKKCGIEVRSKKQSQNTSRQKKTLSENWRGENNPNFGVSPKDQFIRDYGKEKGKEKWRKFEQNRKEKIRGKNNPAKRTEVKKKIRKAKINCIKKQNKEGQVYPFYNPKACELIEKYGEKHGYNFQHAENGGEYQIEELGYWVDGYDEEANVVIEVDESHHFKNGDLRERDKQRQQEIENHLGCDFIRIPFK